MLNPSRTPTPEVEQHPLTHVEEQEILRRETIAAFHGAVDHQTEDDFLIPREKTQDERELEEEEYREFLEREVGDLRDANNELSNEKQKETKAEKDQEFLMKYVNNTFLYIQVFDHLYQLHPKSWLD